MLLARDCYHLLNVFLFGELRIVHCSSSWLEFGMV